MVDLKGTDLNLLASLNVLIEEANVTRAAARLNISQPALSAQLARLRHLATSMRSEVVDLAARNADIY